jgi:hypothetical protein
VDCKVVHVEKDKRFQIIETEDRCSGAQLLLGAQEKLTILLA